MNYELVLGMKVKSCINPQRWGATIDLDFPRIYVWDCKDIKGLNVTKGRMKGCKNECIPNSLSLDQESLHPHRSCLQQHLQQAEGSDQLAEPVQNIIK